MAESNSDTLDNNITHKKAHHHHTHRAHFVEPHKQDDLDAHDSKIVVEPLGHETVNVRLGFLQVKHTYEVHFTIEDGLGEDVTFDPLENLHAKFQSVNPSEDGKGKGTPSLKEGIHCVRIDGDEDTDDSDWQGF
uniref:Adipose-secreted signaling protein n=1 Tax=Arion vulgaris TaxID=1028688 RepID=A0A0B6ZXT8_9EUPU